MQHDLGRWAVLDIETTGVDPSYDQIIDIGFIEYEGLEEVRRYNSLVRYEGELSQFIQKLTGINNKMVHKAPLWTIVEPEVSELIGAKIMAHNAGFEESFLRETFRSVLGSEDKDMYVDSMDYLALLFPQMGSLKLENFIQMFGLREHEIHRGFEDSVDMLKAVLSATYLVKKDVENYSLRLDLFKKYGLTNWWFFNIFKLAQDELVALADTVELDLDAAVENYYAYHKEQNGDQDITHSDFELGFSGENIKKIYSQEEVIKEKLPFYRGRKTQQELSLRAGQSFKNNIHSLIQAPTGTGKTFGYLLPATLFAIESGEQALVATGTKTLQHQAMDKDIPQMRKLLGLPKNQLRVARLVGSNNHLCELMFRQNDQGEDLLVETKPFHERLTDMYFELIFHYNGKVKDEDIRLRDDLPYVLKKRWDTFSDREKEIAVDFRSCTGSRCPFKSECTYINGLRAAKEAHIVVGNHSLMFTWPKGFPRPRYVVVDEAHRLEEETTKAFAMETSENSFTMFLKSMQQMQGIGALFYLLAEIELSEGQSTAEITKIREETIDTASRLQDNLKELPTWMEAYFKKMPRYTDTFWNELPMLTMDKAFDDLGVKIIRSLESIRFILSSYMQTLVPYITQLEGREFREDGEVMAKSRFDKFLGVLEDHCEHLNILIDGKKGHTHSMRYHESEGFAFQSAPIDIGQIIHDQLLATSSSVVFTSATLGNANGDTGVRGIEWATGYSYLEAEKRFKQGFYLPATYDYENNTKVFLCDDTLPIYDSNFVVNTMKEVMPLIRHLEGRTLLLFSARKRFELAREVLLKEFEGEIPLFIQGMGNNVVDEFKESTNGILLGMETFGEGIDIPGETLQFVFIDKIPDLRQDLVINERRQFYDSNIGNEFTDYYLGHRTRSLHQKLGRLLRTESDIGGIIVVDSRIRRWKGKTMDKFINMMKPYAIQRKTLKEACSEVIDFIAENNDQVDALTNPYRDCSDTLSL